MTDVSHETFYIYPYKNSTGRLELNFVMAIHIKRNKDKLATLLKWKKNNKMISLSQHLTILSQFIAKKTLLKITYLWWVHE